MFFVFAADVDGSVEAILEVLATYNSNKCTLDIIGWGVGPLTDKELELAKTFTGEYFGLSNLVDRFLLKKIVKKKFNLNCKFCTVKKKNVRKNLEKITFLFVLPSFGIRRKFGCLV